LAVAVCGGLQPDCLHSVLVDGDEDGLSARFLLVWPEAVPPKRPRVFARQGDLTAAFRRLRELPLPSDQPGSYVAVPLDDKAADIFQAWRQEDHRAALERAAGRFLGHVGKLPALVLRLALILEFLWWSRRPDRAEPATIGCDAVTAALCLVEDYFLPMAERCYGDAMIPEPERHAAYIARWIRKARPAEINARQLRREDRAGPKGSR